MNTIEVANLSLSHLRTDRTLQAIPDGTTVGETVDLFIDTSRRQMLREFPFAWTSRVVTLAEHTVDPPPDWQYRYAYPTDALTPREILVAGMKPNDDEIPFTTELLPESDSLSLLTDAGDAQLRYTVDLADIERWPDEAAMALSWLLAANMCPSLRGDTQMLPSLYDMYRRLSHAAIVNDGNAQRYKEPKQARSISARGGY